MNELTKYLDPAVLGRIQRLDLMARRVVEGFLSGRHRSPFRGFAVEFAEHREYVPGDDIRHIDWKVYCKTDRYYIKQYEEETNLNATFLVDASESMQYRSGRADAMSKYHYAACVAASLSLLLLNQQDAVGLATFDEDVRTVVPPSANPNHIKTLVHALDTPQSPGAKTSLEAVCHTVAEKIPRRGMICLVSDLFTDLDGLIRGLQHFRHRGHDVIVLHVMDEDELTFPFQGNTLFEGLEGAGRMTVRPRSLRADYLQAVGRFCDDVRRRCIAHRIDYKLISTTDNLGAALAAFLAAKTASAKKSSSKR